MGKRKLKIYCNHYLGLKRMANSEGRTVVWGQGGREKGKIKYAAGAM